MRRQLQPQAAAEPSRDAQQQVPSLLVDPIEVGKRRALFDDKDRLSEAQQLVEPLGGELGEALPFERDVWHAGQTARLRRSSCSRRIMARSAMSQSTSGRGSN